MVSKSIFMNPVLESDLREAALSVDMTPLTGRTILVTGATGLLGSLIVRTLHTANRNTNLGLRILAAARDMEKARALFRLKGEAGGIRLIPHDLSAPFGLKDPVDYIFHCAAPTQSRFFVEHPVETMAAIVDGTRHMLDYALRCKAAAMVYLSSMEIYGEIYGEAAQENVRETDYGYLDPLRIRSSYPEAKRLAECLCAAYARQHGVPVCVARLTQTFGAGVSYHDPRVFAEFARCVIEGRDIVLRTAGDTRRSYCYTTDAVTALLTLLIKGKQGEAYNVANRATCLSIRELAEIMASMGKGTCIATEYDTAGLYPPAATVNLNTDKLESLGWRPRVGLSDMLGRLLENMRWEREIPERIV